MNELEKQLTDKIKEYGENCKLQLKIKSDLNFKEINRLIDLIQHQGEIGLCRGCGKYFFDKDMFIDQKLGEWVCKDCINKKRT